MALPLIAAGAMAGMSILGGILGNQSNAAALKSNVEQINKDYDYQIAQIGQMMKDSNENAALEMTANRWNSLKTTASTSNMLAEKEVAGNTAARLYNQSKLNAMFSHNALQKKAEDTMASFGYKMDNVKQEANNAIYSAAASAKKSTISPLTMGSSALSAGVSGYVIGGGLENFLKDPVSKSQTAGASIG